LPYDTLDSLRGRMVEIAPTFSGVDKIAPAVWDNFGEPGEMSGQAFAGSVENFYLTDVIARASDTMAKCSSQFVARNQKKTGTNG